MIKDILITGATGFVGKHLIEGLEKTQHNLHLLVRNQAKLSSVPKNGSVIDYSQPDWKEKVKKANPDIVLHLASYLSSADDEQTINKLIEANISFGTHLLDALQLTKMQCFVNTGTFAEYKENQPTPSPIYLYAATKTAFRSILDYYRAATGFKIVNVIPYTIYGGIDSKKKLIDYIYDSIFSNENIKMSPGKQILDFIHIKDVVAFYLKLVEDFQNIKTDISEVHLGTGNGTTPMQLATMIEAVSKRKTNINWGGLPYRKMDTMHSVASRNLGSDLLAWSPKIKIEDGIGEYIKLLQVNTKA